MNVDIDSLLFMFAAVAYATATVVFILYLMGNERFKFASLLAPRLVGLAALLHASHVVISLRGQTACPVQGVHFTMSVMALLSCGVYLAMRRRYSIDVVGAFIAPLSLTFLLASRFVHNDPLESDPSSRVKSAILPIHITANLVGDAFFALAFAAAVAYLIQERQIKTKKVDGLFHKLPALDVLDRTEHRLLLAGFPLLTLGLLTGTIWARRVEAGSPTDLARAVFGYLSWLLFAGVLLLRAGWGWRGRRAAYGTILGFAFAVLVLLVYLLRSGGPNRLVMVVFA